MHSTGEAAGQDVFHLHTHVIPRRRGDGLRPMWDERPAAPAEPAEILERMTAGPHAGGGALTGMCTTGMFCDGMCTRGRPRDTPDPFLPAHPAMFDA